MAHIMNMDRNDYPSPRTFVCEEANGLERGLILCIDGHVENGIWLNAGDEDFEAYKVRLAADGDKKEDLLIHTTVPFAYDERLGEKDFILKEGQVGRGHVIKTGDEYTLPLDFVQGVANVGDKVGLDANGKLVKDAPVVLGVVMKLYNWCGQESCLVRFI